MSDTTDSNPTETKPAEIVKETIQAPHKFSTDEKLTLSERLVQSMQTQEQIQAEFDSCKAEFKGRIEKQQLETDSIAQKLRDGFEMRPTLSRVLFNTPHIGRKTFVREPENGELPDDITPLIVREEAMTFADQERPLFRDKNGKDATATGPGEEPMSEAEVAEVFGMTEGGENAGETPLGDAIDKAAAESDQPKIVLPTLMLPDWEPNALVKAAQKACKEAGWPVAAIQLLKETLKKCDVVTAMQATLRPHVIGLEEAQP
jgi:hypothetical protein